MLIAEETRVINEAFLPKVNIMSSCIVYNVQQYISMYALCQQSCYVARVVFQSLTCSWQTALYTSATIANLSINGMFYF